METKTNNLLLLLINAFIVISTIVIVILGITSGAGEGQVGENMTGGGYFKAFTTDSNVLMGIVAGIMLVFNIKNVMKKQYEIPKWVTILYFVGTSAVALTFATVLLFLAPMQTIMGHGFLFLYSGQMIFSHLINPVLAMIAVMFLIKQTKIPIKQVWFGIIPTIVYSIPYIINVAILKTWSDFYGFTFGGKMFLVPVALVVMYGASFGLAFLLAKVHNKNLTENIK